jgi:hypothetical protein
VSLALGLAGCNPGGTGTVEVSKPGAIQAKEGSGGSTVKPASEKQAKALEVEEQAAKKHPKLR